MSEENWPEDWIDPETGERLTTTAKHRSGPYAKPIDYYDYDEDAELACWKCGWHGQARDGSRGYYKELFDISCPKCDTMLLIVSHPTIDETKEAAASGNARAQAALPTVHKVEERLQRADELALKRADQLPELPGKKLAFTWHLEQSDGEHWTLVMLGDTLVWRELAYWEGWERFNEVKAILKKGYGQRFQSLTPAPGSAMYLFGDDTSASNNFSTT
jgi:hypothetical protein